MLNGSALLNKGDNYNSNLIDIINIIKYRYIIFGVVLDTSYSLVYILHVPLCTYLYLKSLLLGKT